MGSEYATVEGIESVYVDRLKVQDRFKQDQEGNIEKINFGVCCRRGDVGSATMFVFDLLRCVAPTFTDVERAISLLSRLKT